jgi:hypothetical protein
MSLIDRVLFGPTIEMRFVQDSPVLPEVWSAFAASPDKRAPLLITPYKGVSGGQLAVNLRESLKASENEQNATDVLEKHQLSYIENTVVVNLCFKELLSIVLPKTYWLHRHLEDLRKKNGPKLSSELFVRSALATVFTDPNPPWPRYDLPMDLARIVTLAAFINLDRSGWKSIEEDLNYTSRKKHLFADAAKQCAPLLQSNENTEALIWLVSLNRPVFQAVSRSVLATKADAARLLFDIDCSKITWAVIDSGIDANHPAFTCHANKSSRVEEIYDFTKIRTILSASNGLSEEQKNALITDLSSNSGLGENQVDKNLDKIAADVSVGRLVDWKPVQKLLRCQKDTPPYSDHGTHVAGILAANWQRDEPDHNMIGVCPHIKLMDFRVLSSTLIDMEFAVIAVLQFIRYLNEQSGYMRVHGVNLSLQIPHDFRNYACGRTPVCEEANRLASNGVVVVAAAGNFGYQLPDSKNASLGGYRTVTITDPGNADKVITVGATHRYRPHDYGVSFFSSRGPTGDGRIKPDLVAPGEKIEAPIPNESYGLKDGTSMAVPHVSGAAALLLARYPELIGKPAFVKEILCKSATDLGREKYFQGAGMLDVLRALQSI